MKVKKFGCAACMLPLLSLHVMFSNQPVPYGRVCVYLLNRSKTSLNLPGSHLVFEH